MKLQPLTFQAIYSDRAHGDYEEQAGFKSIFGETENILARYVEVQFLEWVHGVYMQVKIFESVVPKKESPYMRALYSQNIYDFPYKSDHKQIVPTQDQALLMRAIYDCSMQRDLANRAMQSLYVNLIVLHPNFPFEKYLPEVKKFYICEMNGEVYCED